MAKKPKKKQVGKGTLVAAAVVDEPGSGAVTPSVLPEDVEMVSASLWMSQSFALRNGYGGVPSVCLLYSPYYSMRH